MQNFYMVINAILFAYACYSWYWQAKLDLRGKFRLSVLIWTLIIIWLGFSWNYIESGDPGINFFLALIIFVSIIDGFTGLAPKWAVVSGYFKRTVKYSEIDGALLINVPSPKSPSVICILKTNNGRQYYLRFRGEVSQVIGALKRHTDHNIKIEINSII
ncbi:hypothetical protein [Lactobacillus xujianguonis]|uniref:hypothetical protein n=1 Tax=Lactobacillus xujianguonis TaxID=2495899 RepID=UPI000FDA06E0|nr:hypothetical protein [Lactobacillus xujianguonis]RVU76779.1 hypothetical protein EJK20_03910 [Lactobacillus xujianguonis]